MLRSIERAGRTCYKSERKITPDSAVDFVRRLLKRGHESVIEHEHLSVRFVCDRGVSHEQVRHRLASFSQESTRYCDYSREGHGGEISVISTSIFDWPGEAIDVWVQAMINAEAAYFALRDIGIPPEEARSVLPNSLKTEIVVTTNLRHWREIFRQRTPKAAHPQMRQLMRPRLAELRALVPVLFDDVGVTEGDAHREVLRGRVAKARGQVGQ